MSCCKQVYMFSQIFFFKSILKTNTTQYCNRTMPYNDFRKKSVCSSVYRVAFVFIQRFRIISKSLGLTRLIWNYKFKQTWQTNVIEYHGWLIIFNEKLQGCYLQFDMIQILFTDKERWPGICIGYNKSKFSWKHWGLVERFGLLVEHQTWTMPWAWPCHEKQA